MMDVITKTVAQEVSREADTSKESTIDLEKRYRAAVTYLEEATTNVQPMWIEMLKQQQKTLEDVRIWRMAMESELRISERAVGGDVELFHRVQEAWRQFEAVQKKEAA